MHDSWQDTDHIRKLYDAELITQLEADQFILYIVMFGLLMLAIVSVITTLILHLLKDNLVEVIGLCKNEQKYINE